MERPANREVGDVKKRPSLPALGLLKPPFSATKRWLSEGILPEEVIEIIN